MSCREKTAALIIWSLIDIYCTYSDYKFTIIFLVSLSHTFSLFFPLAHTHSHTNTGRLHPSLSLADLSWRAESRCTCVLFPGLYSQGLRCTSAWVHLLVHTRRTFACIVISSICGGGPWLQGYGWIVEEGRHLQYLFADLLIFTEGTCELFFRRGPFLFCTDYTAALIQMNLSLRKTLPILLFLWLFMFKVYVLKGIIQKWITTNSHAGIAQLAHY